MFVTTGLSLYYDCYDSSSQTCPSFSVNMPRSRTIDRVEINACGNDAFLLDRAWLKKDGATIKNWWANNGGVECITRKSVSFTFDTHISIPLKLKHLTYSHAHFLALLVTPRVGHNCWGSRTPNGPKDNVLFYMDGASYLSSADGSKLPYACSSSPGESNDKETSLVCYDDHSLWKGTERQQQELSHHHVARRLRKITLHAQPDDIGNAQGWTMSREEIVDALESDDDSLIEVAIGTNVFVITRAHMQVSPPGRDNYSGAFHLTNKFAEGSDTTYRIQCPNAASGKDVCRVVIIPTPGKGTNCFNDADKVELARQDISSKCLDQVYKMRLQADGQHFFLTGIKGEDSPNDGCPPNIAFGSRKGKKHMAVVIMDPRAKLLPTIELGSATLKDVLKAEEAAEPLNDSEYDLTKNSCVHYAGRLWRFLGFEETNELALFLIDNIVGSGASGNGFKEIAKNHRVSGGLRALAAFAMGEEALKSYIEEVVYSQLVLVEPEN